MFDQNWNLFVSSFGEERASSIDHNKVLANKSAKIVDDDLISYILLSDIVPRNQEVRQRYNKLCEPFQQTRSVTRYLGHLDGDPHLMTYLGWIPQQLQIQDVDYTNALTTTDGLNPEFLVCLNPGDGLSLLRAIRRFNPSRLIVAVSCWEHYVSSFWNVDWLNIWNHFSNKGSDSIQIGCYDSGETILGILGSIDLLGIDHTPVIHSLEPSDDEKFVLDSLTDKNNTNNMFNYLGFMLDEYNMIYDAWRTLSCEPPIYNKPSAQLAKKIVVCGSGPSLDESIETIKMLSKSHLIIASGSNLRTLLANNIKPDICVLMERGAMNKDDYSEVAERYGLDGIKLVASVTCTYELQDIFDETCAFYRPVLTPLAIFCDDQRQILHFEGPQSINAGVSLACSFLPEEVVFVGIDLGTKSLERVRSADAAGVSPRDFNLESPANFGGSVYTEKYLLDGKKVVEACIKNYSHIKFKNLSDGVLITGAEPIRHTDYARSQPTDDIKELDNFHIWWSSLRPFDRRAFSNSWSAGRPRSHIRNLLVALRDVIDNSQIPLFPDAGLKIQELLSFEVPKYIQFPRRIIRSYVLRSLLAIKRQTIVLNTNLSARDEFIFASRSRLSKSLHEIEAELYELCDIIEAQV